MIKRAWVGLVALAASGAVAGCGSGEQEPSTIKVVTGPPPQAVSSAEPEPDAANGQTAQGGGDLEASEVEAARSARPPSAEATLALETPARAYPVIWVRAGHEVEVRTEPGGELVERVGRKTQFGSPSVFGVAEQRGGWAGVPTPLLPNGRLGWIRLDPKRVEAGWTEYSIVVDVSDRSAALLEAGRSRFEFPVTVGAPGSDTPTGRFAVTDTFTDLDSAAYGCCAVALTANQPDLPSGWLGGERIAIHGTSGPLGVAASHGCVRAADDDVARLIRRVPLGTPVFVRA